MRYLTAIIFFALSFIATGHAQIVIGKPSLGFSQACASPSFNTYHTTFAFSPDTALEASNQFTIELSDATGDFSSASIIYTSTPGEVTTSPATLTFSLPNTTSGESYKLRIKSTAPVASSTASVAFAAYYKIQNTPFSINNLIETGSYCSGGSYLLTIDNPGDSMNDSPLKYPSLSFNWFRVTGLTSSEFVASGNTLAVNTPGVYFAETNYGTCTSDSFSNRVTVGELETGVTTFDIKSSIEIPYCASEGPTTLTAINGSAYQWYINGTEIPGATNQMYSTNLEGTYSVNVDLGNCSTSASIVLENTDFTASINVDETNIIEPDETLEVIVETTAINPEFVWYLNDTPITGASTDTFEASQKGNYKVEVKQTSGCVSIITFEFEVDKMVDLFPDVENIPNVISPNGDGENDTWVIPISYVSGTTSEVIIMSSQGEIVFKTDDYQNNWPQEPLELNGINPVYYYIITTPNKEKKQGSITVIK